MKSRAICRLEKEKEREKSGKFDVRYFVRSSWPQTEPIIFIDYMHIGIDTILVSTHEFAEYDHYRLDV